MKKHFKHSLFLFSLFLLWTVSVCFIDVKNIGPQNSSVGLSSLNLFFHKLFGVHLNLYYITDFLSIIPLLFIAGFGFIGLIQLIKRKNILKVDFNIIMLGVFYIVVMAFFVFFEIFSINYRPILIEGVLEASYPSSTTMLSVCVMLTAAFQFNIRIKNKTLKKSVSLLIYIFTFFMITARLISGVHWFTDIIGGLLLSFSLVFMYYNICNKKSPVN